jgi:putative methionine-R-sulfoxide reductase with GAF domain
LTRRSGPGDKAGESVLKALITEPVISIERKGFDVVQVRNCLHIIIASNSDWVVPAVADERRFCVLDVDAAHQQVSKYLN